MAKRGDDVTQGDMIERVEKLLESEKTIPVKLRNELVLSLLMEQSRMAKRTLTDVQALGEAVRTVNTRIDTELATVRADVDAVRQKSIALWVQANPKRALAVLLVFSLLMNLWFESGFLRQMVAWLLGVPEDMLG